MKLVHLLEMDIFVFLTKICTNSYGNTLQKKLLHKTECDYSFWIN